MRLSRDPSSIVSQITYIARLERPLTAEPPTVGTGATAIQAIPVIAETAKSLTVFQRTPNWVSKAEQLQPEMTSFPDFATGNPTAQRQDRRGGNGLDPEELP